MTISNFTTFNYNGVTYTNIASIAVNRLPHRDKQTNGRRVNMVEVIGSNTYDRIIDISINFTPNSSGSISNLTTAYDGQKHAYSDGVHTGDFVMETGSLNYDSDAESKQVRRATFRLVEW